MATVLRVLSKKGDSQYEDIGDGGEADSSTAAAAPPKSATSKLSGSSRKSLDNFHCQYK